MNDQVTNTKVDELVNKQLESLLIENVEYWINGDTPEGEVLEGTCEHLIEHNYGHAIDAIKALIASEKEEAKYEQIINMLNLINTEPIHTVEIALLTMKEEVEAIKENKDVSK